MKNKILQNLTLTVIILGLSSLNTVNAQYNLEWAYEYTPTPNGLLFNYISGISYDAQNNYYVTGYYFNDTLDVDFSAGVTNLVSTNTGYAMYIAKYNTNGNLVWAKNFAADNSDILSQDIKVDASGNVFVVGTLPTYNSNTATVDFDPGPGVYNVSLGSKKGLIWILKLNSNGDFQWVKEIALDNGFKIDASKIQLDASGNVFVSGIFDKTLEFSPSVQLNGINSYVESGFLAKYNASGNFEWAKGFIINSNNLDDKCHIKGISITNNNIFIAGFYKGNPDFNPGTGVDTLTNTNFNSFIVKLDLNGDYVFAKRIITENFISSMQMDENNNLYVVGEFFGTVDFNPSTATNELTSNGSWDGFIAKYDENGNYLWAKSLGGNGYDGISNITLTNNGVAAVGYYSQTVDFDPGSGVAQFTAVEDDCFLLLLDANGNYDTNYVWGGDLYDYTKFIVNDNADNFLIAGDNGSTNMDYDAFDRGGPIAIQFLMKLSPINSTSIHEETINSSFIYPNPASTQFTIAQAEIGSQIKLIDMTGKVVLSETISNTIHTIHTQGLANGMYLVQIEYNGQINQQKMIIQK